MGPNPPAAAANPRLWELNGDLQFWSLNSEGAGEDDVGDAGRGRMFPRPFLRGDGPWMLTRPWQRGC